ncbi:DUSP12 [Lepeophtheirus salmonis]|uniref:protein-tyrosine-phosphatase n=2 Tax=Lepeophtheirus salmonis TaxID=72036 RepID=A0A7R8H0L6_LEPSM|nr:DUSP12 [Lepeophtheirus salmonis]CAF2793415.1 DUSP12 [Lepeophtheirus salmonis]
MTSSFSEKFAGNDLFEILIMSCMVSYNHIVHRLYLGDYESANSPLLLDKLGVTALVSIDIVPPQTQLLQLAIKILDKEDEDLLSELPSIIEFISKEIASGGTILVHCFHGVSRSASAVIAYLMQTKDISLEESLSFVKVLRPSIDPNPGFMKQLQLYSLMNCTLRPNHYPFRRCNLKFHFYAFPHTPSQKLDWSVVEPKVSASYCNLGFFIESIHEGNLQDGDKIKCRKCQNKLGRFSRNLEMVCPCGTSLKPGYWINASQKDSVHPNKYCGESLVPSNSKQSKSNFQSLDPLFHQMYLRKCKYTYDVLLSLVTPKMTSLTAQKECKYT